MQLKTPEEKEMALFIHAKVKELYQKLYKVPLVKIVEEFKGAIVAKALELTSGHRGNAGKLLNLGASTFRELAKHHNLIALKVRAVKN